MMCWHLIASLWGWASQGNALPAHLFWWLAHIVFHVRKGRNYLQIQVLWTPYKARKKPQIWKTGPLTLPTTNLQDNFSASLWSSFVDHVQARPASTWKDKVGKWGGGGCHNRREEWKAVWGWADTRKTSRGAWSGPHHWTVACSDRNSNGTKRNVAWNNWTRHLKNTRSHLSNNLSIHHYEGLCFVA